MVAVSVGALASGISANDICVALSTCMSDTVTFPVPTVTLSGVIGHVAVALALVVNPVPVIVTTSAVPSGQVLGDMEVICGVAQPGYWAEEVPSHHTCTI
jgi:hypothetical protein